jgi:hypothetical protein
MMINENDLNFIRLQAIEEKLSKIMETLQQLEQKTSRLENEVLR